METTRDSKTADAAPAARNPRDYAELLATPHSDAFAFSEREEIALGLYDQLKELELQRSVLEAQSGVDTSDVMHLSDRDIHSQLIIAEREAMQAKVEYELRNRITRNVLVMDPVLKAVHGGSNTNHAEKRILPLVPENDIVSMLHGYLTSKLTTASGAVGAAEQGNMTANEKNRQLSKTLLALAEDMRAQSTADIDDPQLREKVNAVEREAKESRRRLVSLKSMLAGMIVGSGIDWAEDDALRELVLDDEDDG